MSRGLELLEAKRSDIEALCRRYKVKRLWVFGSATTEQFDPARSDLDFVVEFDPPEGISPAAQYFDFWEDLKALLGREVDLVERCAVRNPVFLRNIQHQERLLYEA
ncbi:MAG: nucleotidyltransferase family protein [Fimbriimonadales bacterium]